MAITYLPNDGFEHYHTNSMSDIPFMSASDSDDDGFTTILDMDSIKHQIDPILSSHSGESNPFRDYDNFDGTSWMHKTADQWSEDEADRWLLTTRMRVGQAYSSMRSTFSMTGKDLLCLTREDFIARESSNGEAIYDLLHACHSPAVSRSNSTPLPSFQTFHLPSEDEMSKGLNFSDAESDNSIEVERKRPPGRPRVSKPLKKLGKGQNKLWEFIRDLLHNPETNPQLICWEDYSEAKFRFVRSDKVAKLWGSRKANDKMNYEKLSRAMRYYYKSEVFRPVFGRRLVYQFGRNATGWQTDNPIPRN